MRWNIVGAFIRNNPFGTEIAFRKGLERIGETVTAVDPGYPNQRFDEAPDVTLVFKWLDPGPYRSKVASLPGKKIVYQVDDLRFSHIKDMMIKMREICDHALTFDEDGARLAREYGYESAQRMLLTADNVLYRHIPKMQKDIDVCFVGSLSHGPNHVSRMKMLDIVKKMGVKLVVANELFDIGKICELYNRSKIVLNHATDVGQPFGHGFGYQCRHFEAGFTKSLVLSNVIDNDNVIYFPTFTSEIHLPAEIDGWLHAESLREETAQRLYDELYARHLPEHRAQEMVDFVRSIQ
jgi:hypothetical protein